MAGVQREGMVGKGGVEGKEREQRVKLSTERHRLTYLFPIITIII